VESPGNAGADEAAAARRDHHNSHFGSEANLFEELETTFRDYSETGVGRTRAYVHDADEAELHGSPPGTFTPWSRANSIVIPGGKLDIAMQLILTPMILKLVERRRRALRA
jgi:phosphoribulokinase